MNIKKEIQENFDRLYKSKRLLAVQLNGFSHKVFYDNGTKDSKVIVEEYSPWIKTERDNENTKKLMQWYSTYQYKGNPKEIIYVDPKER